MAVDQIKRKHGLPWRARVLLPNGKRMSRCFPRKVDAEQWEAKLKTEGLASAELKKKQTTFDGLCALFLRSAKAELSFSTYKRYESTIRKYLLPAFKDLWVEDISRVLVEDFKNELLGTPLASASKRFVFCSLNTIFRKGMDLELLTRNPAQSVKRPKGGMIRTVYWTEEEANQFLAITSGTSRFPLYYIALNTGMRLGEILGLQWDCVNFKSGFIEIRRTFDQKSKVVKETTKTHKARTIGMSPPLREFLMKIRAERTSGSVISLEAMNCRNACHATREFNSDTEKAGLKPIRFHDLRHTYATLFAGKGGSIHALSGVLGHSTSAMTARYAHFTPEHAKAAAGIVAFDFVIENAQVISMTRKLSGHRLVTKT